MDIACSYEQRLAVSYGIVQLDIVSELGSTLIWKVLLDVTSIQVMVAGDLGWH